MKKLFYLLLVVLGTSCSNEKDSIAYSNFESELKMTSKYPESVKISNFKKVYENGDSLQIFNADVEARKDPTRTKNYKFEYIYLITEDETYGVVTDIKDKGDYKTRFEDYKSALEKKYADAGLDFSEDNIMLLGSGYDNQLKKWIVFDALAKRLGSHFNGEGLYW